MELLPPPRSMDVVLLPDPVHVRSRLRHRAAGNPKVGWPAEPGQLARCRVAGSVCACLLAQARLSFTAFSSRRRMRYKMVRTAMTVEGGL